jgi:hypothetical protein
MQKQKLEKKNLNPSNGITLQIQNVRNFLYSYFLIVETLGYYNSDY